MPPSERKPPEPEKVKPKQASTGNAESEMEVEESEVLIRRPDIKPPPTGRGASGPQATEGNRCPFIPASGSHIEEAINKRFHNLDNRHEVHAQEDRRRKSKIRDLKVSQLRGSALKETAQQVRREEKGTGQETTCTKEMQVDTSPFLKAPTSNVTPIVEALGATPSMEF